MRRLAIFVSVCCVLVAASACGDDGDGDGGGNGDQQAQDTTQVDKKAATKRVVEIRRCTAKVSTTGAHEAAWKGDAEVRIGGRPADATGPQAVYTLRSEKSRLALYSPGNEFKGSVSLSVGTTTYASDPADAESFQGIDETGKSAHVDVTLTSIEGDTLDLVADFICDTSKTK